MRRCAPRHGGPWAQARNIAVDKERRDRTLARCVRRAQDVEHGRVGDGFELVDVPRKRKQRRWVIIDCQHLPRTEEHDHTRSASHCPLICLWESPISARSHAGGPTWSRDCRAYPCPPIWTGLSFTQSYARRWSEPYSTLTHKTVTCSGQRVSVTSHCAEVTRSAVDVDSSQTLPLRTGTETAIGSVSCQTPGQGDYHSS